MGALCMTLRRASPQRLKSALNSSTLRSTPPVTASMLRSTSFIGAKSLPGGTNVSATITRPCGGRTRLTAPRMVAARSSSQSWMTFLST